jgi:cytidine deaminase
VHKEHQIKYQQLNSSAELENNLQALLQQAKDALQNAYAPYSKFQVGAAVLMADGAVHAGFNIENAAYSVCICAERTALSAAITKQPNDKIIAIAISYQNQQGSSTEPISPCGVCRQFLYECELRNTQPIQVICAGITGEVIVFDNCGCLLPFGFDGRKL